MAAFVFRRIFLEKTEFSTIKNYCPLRYPEKNRDTFVLEQSYSEHPETWPKYTHTSPSLTVEFVLPLPCWEKHYQAYQSDSFSNDQEK